MSDTPTIPDPSATLADLAAGWPGAARVLDRLELDYCCRGQRSLAEACATAGLDLARVQHDLAVGYDPDDDLGWMELDVVGLVDHLEHTHHRYLHEELPRLGALGTKVLGAHGGRHPELAEVVATLDALRADLEPHLLKEERILFPMIRELATAAEAPAFPCGSLVNPIRVMLAEHDQAGDLLARLRHQAGGHEPPADACGSWRAWYAGLAELEADTHRHVHKENARLFPLVISLEADAPPA